LVLTREENEGKKCFTRPSKLTYCKSIQMLHYTIVSLKLTLKCTPGCRVAHLLF